MNRLALALAAISAPGLVLVGLLASSDVVPTGVAPALAAIGGITAAVGAWRSRPRVHAGGAVLAVLGAAATGVALDTVTLAIGVASATLMIASVNFHLVLSDEQGGLGLVVVALIGTAAVTGLALLAGRFAEWIGGGGVDATGGVTAWVVLVVAVSWGLARWVMEAEPG